MSLNKFLNLEVGKNLGLKIGCVEMDCGSMVVGDIVMPTGANIDAHDITANDITIENELKTNNAVVENELKVNGTTDIGGNNYVTPTLGMPTWSLHTDGNGGTYWDVDSTGNSDIQYAGTPPTIAGQLTKFSTTSGKSVEQSNIIDDGTNLNLGTQNITNVNDVEISGSIVLTSGGTPDSKIVNDNFSTISFLNENDEYFLTFAPDLIATYNYADSQTGNRNIKTRGRGTSYDTRQGLLAFDRITENLDIGTDSSGVQGQGCSVVSICPTPWTPTSHETLYQISTCNLNSINPTLKLDIGTDGVKVKTPLFVDGLATFNFGSNSFTLPLNNGNENDVLTMINGTGQSVWKGAKETYTLLFGANMGNAPKRLWANGDHNLVANDNNEVGNRFVIPKDCVITRIAYDTFSGDALTIFEILKNNVSQGTFNLGGANGVFTLGISCVAGDFVGIRHTNGTTCNNTIASLYCEIN